MEVITILKRLMRLNKVKQIVVVDDGCEVPMLHINRADFEPSAESALCVFPGPWIGVDNPPTVGILAGWKPPKGKHPQGHPTAGGRWRPGDGERAADRIAGRRADGRRAPLRVERFMGMTTGTTGLSRNFPDSV
jgi:hypothetical protein